MTKAGLTSEHLLSLGRARLPLIPADRPQLLLGRIPDGCPGMTMLDCTSGHFTVGPQERDPTITSVDARGMTLVSDGKYGDGFARSVLAPSLALYDGPLVVFDPDGKMTEFLSEVRPYTVVGRVVVLNMSAGTMPVDPFSWPTADNSFHKFSDWASEVTGIEHDDIAASFLSALIDHWGGMDHTSRSCLPAFLGTAFAFLRNSNRTDPDSVAARRVFTEPDGLGRWRWAPGVRKELFASEALPWLSDPKRGLPSYASRLTGSDRISIDDVIARKTAFCITGGRDCNSRFANLALASLVAMLDTAATGFAYIDARTSRNVKAHAITIADPHCGVSGVVQISDGGLWEVVENDDQSFMTAFEATLIVTPSRLWYLDGLCEYGLYDRHFLWGLERSVVMRAPKASNADRMEVMAELVREWEALGEDAVAIFACPMGPKEPDMFARLPDPTDNPLLAPMAPALNRHFGR